MEAVNLRIRIEDEADYDAAAEVVEGAQGATLEVVTQGGAEAEVAIAPVIAVLVGVGILGAGKFILDLIDRMRGGVVIDQRPDAVDDIYRDKALPFGWVVVRPSDGGKVEIEVKDAPKDMVERLLADLVGGVLKTASSVADAAKAVVGAAKVQSSPSEA